MIPTVISALRDAAEQAVRNHRAEPDAELARAVTTAVLRALTDRLGRGPTARKVQTWLQQMHQPGSLVLHLPATTSVADDDDDEPGLIEVDLAELARQRRMYRARLAVIEAMTGPGEPGGTTTDGQQQWAIRVGGAAAALAEQDGATIFDRADALRLLASLSTGAPTPQLVTRVTVTLHDGTEITTKWQPVRVTTRPLSHQGSEHR